MMKIYEDFNKSIAFDSKRARDNSSKIGKLSMAKSVVQDSSNTSRKGQSIKNSRFKTQVLDISRPNIENPSNKSLLRTTCLSSSRKSANLANMSKTYSKNVKKTEIICTLNAVLSKLETQL
jgi:hypothetical protein